MRAKLLGFQAALKLAVRPCLAEETLFAARLPLETAMSPYVHLKPGGAESCEVMIQFQQLTTQLPSLRHGRAVGSRFALATESRMESEVCACEVIVLVKEVPEASPPSSIAMDMLQ